MFCNLHINRGEHPIVVIIVIVVNGRPVKLLKGTFRLRVGEFLTTHAVPLPPLLSSPLVTWQAAVYLHFVEEEVSTSPRSPYCDHGRIVGWSAHPVCRKRYHFFIKADGHSVGGSYNPCTCCSELLHSFESRCKVCNQVTTKVDVQDWAYQHLENTTHILHVVVHANGFGHMLRVN